MEDKIRLQKYLANCGVASRRASEEIIVSGRVAVNGKKVTELGSKVDNNDKVSVDGKFVFIEKKKIYIILNKPTGVLSSAKAERDLKCVVDLIEDVEERLFPVGRLDVDTSGLILLTNDGDFAQKLTHPAFEIWKAYEAVVKGVPNEADVKIFSTGISLEDGLTLPSMLSVIGYKGRNAIIEVLIREGRNRQVRRMLDAVGHSVITLKRTRLAGLELGDLRPGKWRFLKPTDMSALFR